MSQLLLTCLGDFQVTLAGVPLTGFQTERSRLYSSIWQWKGSLIGVLI
jgi:hypothetical protein